MTAEWWGEALLVGLLTEAVVAYVQDGPFSDAFTDLAQRYEGEKMPAWVKLTGCHECLAWWASAIITISIWLYQGHPPSWAYAATWLVAWRIATLVNAIRWKLT